MCTVLQKVKRSSMNSAILNNYVCVHCEIMCINKDTKCMLSPSMRPIDSIVLSKLTTLHMIQSHLWIEVFVHQDSPLKQMFEMNEISQIHTSLPGRHSFFLNGPTPCTISQKPRLGVFEAGESNEIPSPWSMISAEASSVFFVVVAFWAVWCVFVPVGRYCWWKTSQNSHLAWC